MHIQLHVCVYLVKESVFPFNNGFMTQTHVLELARQVLLPTSLSGQPLKLFHFNSIFQSTIPFWVELYAMCTYSEHTSDFFKKALYFNFLTVIVSTDVVMIIRISSFPEDTDGVPVNYEMLIWKD